MENMATYYRRVTKGVKDRGILLPIGEEYAAIKDPTSDYYMSIYYYNEDQKAKFDKTGTVAGITETVTPYLVWDFDNNDLDKSKVDTLELASRLLAAGLREDEFTICFSGNKGFSVEILTTNKFTPSEFRAITNKLAEGLETRDEKVVNPSRIFRVPLTRHQVSGLYKTPITLAQLSELPVSEIRNLAKEVVNSTWTMHETVLPESVLELQKEEPIKLSKPGETLSNDLNELDFSKRPKGMPSCKYSILNGYFTEGSRNDCMMALAAHFKAIGYPQDIT